MKYNILIIEDNEVTAKFLQGFLSGKGYMVKTIDKGLSIVEEAKEFKPNLLLVDILLPDIDGAEAVKLAQRERELADIPVIFLSAIIEEDKFRGNTITVNDREYPAYSKTISSDDLLKAIETALQKPSQS